MFEWEVTVGGELFLSLSDEPSEPCERVLLQNAMVPLARLSTILVIALNRKDY